METDSVVEVAKAESPEGNKGQWAHVAGPLHHVLGHDHLSAMRGSDDSSSLVHRERYIVTLFR